MISPLTRWLNQLCHYTDLVDHYKQSLRRPNTKFDNDYGKTRTHLLQLQQFTPINYSYISFRCLSYRIRSFIAAYFVLEIKYGERTTMKYYSKPIITCFILVLLTALTEANTNSSSLENQKIQIEEIVPSQQSKPYFRCIPAKNYKGRTLSVVIDYTQISKKWHTCDIQCTFRNYNNDGESLIHCKGDIHPLHTYEKPKQVSFCEKTFTYEEAVKDLKSFRANCEERDEPQW